MRLAVIGTGVMGKNHARVIAGLEGAELAGVFDVDAPAALTIARHHRAKAYQSLEDLVADDSVDGVIVATPTFTHRKIGLQMLEAGKHVLVEKPLASTVEEAEVLTRAAHAAGRVLAVGHIERHNPVVEFAKLALESGEFGDLIHLTARRVSNLPGRIRDVGVIMDIGIHDIDILSYLVGRPVAQVYASGGAFKEGMQFEDHATILLTFDNGVSGSIEVNWLTPMKVRRLNLTARKAYVTLDYMNQLSRIASSSYPVVDEGNLYQVPLELHERVVQLKKQEPLQRELRDFVEASAGKRKNPLVTGEDGLMAIRIAESAIRSIQEKAAVRLK